MTAAFVLLFLAVVMFALALLSRFRWPVDGTGPYHPALLCAGFFLWALSQLCASWPK